MDASHSTQRCEVKPTFFHVKPWQQDIFWPLQVVFKSDNNQNAKSTVIQNDGRNAELAVMDTTLCLGTKSILIFGLHFFLGAKNSQHYIES